MREPTEFAATVQRVDLVAEEVTLICDGRVNRHALLTPPAERDMDLQAGDAVAALDFGDEVNLICGRLQDACRPYLLAVGPPLPALPR
jgi:hypothetical protein